MTTCPLCSDILLRHLRSGKPYWLCRRCRIEILEKNDLIEKTHPTHEASPKGLPLRITAHQVVVRSPVIEHGSSVGHVQCQQLPITTEV